MTTCGRGALVPATSGARGPTDAANTARSAALRRMAVVIFSGMSRSRSHAFVLVFAALSACSETDASATKSQARPPHAVNTPAEIRRVLVNGAALDVAALGELDRAARVRVPDGDYWYDARCGACGARGGPTAAFLPPGLALGATLRADASGGGSGLLTGVFVNGRELHFADHQALSRLGPLYAGRYWLDAHGNWGVEGTEIPLGNLLEAARAATQSGSGYNRATAGGHLLSDGQSAGWFDPKTGASVLVGG